MTDSQNKTNETKERSMKMVPNPLGHGVCVPFPAPDELINTKETSVSNCRGEETRAHQTNPDGQVRHTVAPTAA